MTDVNRSDVELRILSQPRYLCVVRAAVEALAEKIGFDNEACGKIILCVDEAVTNVIRHGYKEQPDKPIVVRLNPVCEASRDGIEIVIEDECCSVDLSRIKPRALDDVRPGGLGTHIMSELMDVARFAHRSDGDGVQLTMRKYLA